jgi:Ca2+-binding EF-hand superfamily protein
MCEKEIRSIRMSPDFAYGNTSPIPSIPSNASLRYEVELLQIKDAETDSTEENIFESIDSDEDGKISRDELDSFYQNYLQQEEYSELADAIWNHDNKDKVIREY